MKLVTLGHAGLLAETRFGSVLCDPWFGGAYYDSWFPFPDNAWLRDDPALRSPDFLYVSHSHPDHFDRAFCAELDKGTTVVLPDYPLDELEQALRSLGFWDFFRTEHGKTYDFEGLKLTVLTDVSPMDGPMGDSALIIDDGETRIFNRNDSRPRDLGLVERLGPYDVHLGQHSGAVWFPVVYRMPPAVKRAMGIRKRRNQLDRYLRYDAVTDATFSVPNSGPPMFLDDVLFDLNDFGDDPSNVYPDQTFALSALGERGRLMLPGSEADVVPGEFRLEAHRMGTDCFGARKHTHIRWAAERERPTIAAMYASLRREPFLLEALMNRFEPLLERSERIAVGVGGNVVIDWGDDAIVLDFVAGECRRWHGDPCVVKHLYEPRILEDMVASGIENWVDDVWSGCRFEAERQGPYNDYVNAFFRCLSPERLDYAESWLEDRDAAGDHEWWTVDGYRVQRFCPHARSDLSRVGRLDGDVLTCAQHGLRFDLRTGRCLDADGLRIRVERT